MTDLTDEAVKALLDEMTFAMFGDGTDDTISEKLARALLDARAELARVKADAALAQTPTEPGDGWTWNERLGWIGPDGKPADPRRRG